MASTTNNSDGGGGGLNKPPQIAAAAPPPALNPVTLSKALAKPPPLSSILNNRSPLLSSQPNGPATTTTSSISTNGPTHSQLPVASVALNGPSVGHANGLASIAATATTSHLFDQSTTSAAAASIARVPTPQQLQQQQQLPKLSPSPVIPPPYQAPVQQPQSIAQPSQTAQIQPTIQPPINNTNNMPSAQSMFPVQQQQQQQQQQQPSPFQAVPSISPSVQYQPAVQPPLSSQGAPQQPQQPIVRPPMFQATTQPLTMPPIQQQQQQPPQMAPLPPQQSFVPQQQTQFAAPQSNMPPQISQFNRPPLATSLPPQQMTTTAPPSTQPPSSMPPRFPPPPQQPQQQQATSIPSFSSQPQQQFQPPQLQQLQQQQQQQQPFAQSQGGLPQMAPPSGPPTGPPLTRPPLPGQQPLTNGPTMPTYSAPPLGPPLPSNVQQNYPPMSQEHFSTQQQQQQQQQLSGPPLGPPQGQPQSYQQQPPLGPPPMTQPGLNRPPLSQQQPIQPNGPSYQQQPQQQQQQQQLINQFQSNMNISQPNNRQNTNMPPPIQQQQQQQQPHVTQNMILNQNRSQPQAIDLQRERRLLMPYAEDTPPRPIFPQEFYNNVNCHYDTMRCTLTSIPENQNLLNKCRLPLGLLIHPFKDLESLKVVQSSTIVRCRNCRTYINPFVQFLDSTKWRCNMCYSINDLPEEFLFDPVTKTYGDPTKRPEINSSTIEFIAPPEYTLRPPPPAMYLYLLDVSHNAVNTGYLRTFCETLLENLDKIPGDARTQIGFITYNSSLHFYNLSEALSQPRMMIYADIGDASDSESLTLPMPDGLLVNLSENRESVQMFLQALPGLFSPTNPSACVETDSALGTALTAGFQLLKPTGGRITVMQTCLPNMGEGALKVRDETIEKDSSNLSPQIDFYKKMALECAGVHIAVDLFMFNSLYSDLPTLSCISKYSGGEIKYYPRYHPEETPDQVVRFSADLKRYLTRKIGFEAVMRLRCTRGLSIHTFHGNFFVRSTDLLALPNVSPDSGFGMQLTIEEPLSDLTTVSLQAAVLYTSSKGERRIRIHTYLLPVTRSVHELVNGADAEAIVGLVAKMAVDRTAMNSLREARDALVNVAIDYLAAYRQHMTSHTPGALITPYALRCIPLYVLALLKNVAFRFANSKMDERAYAMNVMKTMPLRYLMLYVYPDLYALHNFDDTKLVSDGYESEVCIPPRLHLSSENIDRHGVYLLDAGESIYMWVGKSVSDLFLQDVFGCKSFNELPEFLYDLPELENPLLERIRTFLAYLIENRPFGVTFICFKEGSPRAKVFFQHMYEDKSESAFSYYELLRHLSEHVKG